MIPPSRLRLDWRIMFMDLTIELAADRDRAALGNVWLRFSAPLTWGGTSAPKHGSRIVLAAGSPEKQVEFRKHE